MDVEQKCKRLNEQKCFYSLSKTDIKIVPYEEKLKWLDSFFFKTSQDKIL
jgi:hypothetical protein